MRNVVRLLNGVCIAVARFVNDGQFHAPTVWFAPCAWLK